MNRLNVCFLSISICLFACAAIAQAEDNSTGYVQTDSDAQIMRKRSQEKWNRDHSVAPVPTMPDQPAIEPLPQAAGGKAIDKPHHKEHVRNYHANKSKHRHVSGQHKNRYERQQSQ